MSSTALLILGATPALAAAVTSLGVRHMVKALHRSNVDLSDPDAVTVCLHANGFGCISIQALGEKARRKALRRQREAVPN